MARRQRQMCIRDSYSVRRDEALAAMRRATVVSPDSSMWLAQLGQMLDVQSHDTEAREILLRLEDAARERYVSLYRFAYVHTCLLYTSPSPRDRTRSRMPSSACKKKKHPKT